MEKVIISDRVYNKIPVGTLNLHNRLVLLREDRMGPNYKAVEHRTLQVTGGFGCDVGNTGSKIFGIEPDGEIGQWYRSDVECILVPITQGKGDDL